MQAKRNANGQWVVEDPGGEEVVLEFQGGLVEAFRSASGAYHLSDEVAVVGPELERLKTDLAGVTTQAQAVQAHMAEELERTGALLEEALKVNRAKPNLAENDSIEGRGKAE